MSERDVFTAALRIADAAARSAYLDEACAGECALRRRVEMLLAGHAGAGDLPQRRPEPIDGGALSQFATAAIDTAAFRQARLAGTADYDEDVPLDFLQASARPDSLGRIGHYEVLQVLGKGGFGIVFRAFDEVLQRVVAVKVLAPAIAATSPGQKRFLREARASAAVRHENVVQVYEVAEQPLPYLVMEFIPGGTLQQKLDRTGPLEVADVLRIGRQIAEGLAAAHATDLIHRDVKPANVLLEGGTQQAKLTDFGLARAADDASVSQSGLIAGTPMFMAPEQARGETLDQRADLFSLGSVLYTMVSGRPPFRATGTLAVLKRVAEDAPRPIREVIPETPPWLCDVVAKLHAKDPKERFQSAREVADVLAECEAQLKAGTRVKVTGIHPDNPAPGRFGRWRSVAAALLLCVLALILAEGIGLTQWLWTRGDSDAQNSLTPRELAALPDPLDGRKRSEIPPRLLALAGGGDPNKAPAELVAVLGTHGPFTLPCYAPSHAPALSPDRKRLAVTCGHQVAVFDAATGALQATLPGTRRLHNVAFSHDSKCVGGGCDDGKAYVWEIEYGKVELKLDHPASVNNIAFSGDGKRIVTCCGDGCAFVWGRDGQDKTALAKQPGSLRAVAFSPDSKTLAFAGDEGVVVLWDVVAGKVSRSLKGNTSSVHNLRYSPDGNTLASGSDREAILWDAQTGKTLKTLPASSLGLLAFASDGKTLLTARWDEEPGGGYLLTRWDAATGEKAADVPLGPRRRGTQGVRFYAADPDGTTVYACHHGGDDRVSVFDAATGKDRFGHADFHDGPVRAVAVSPDGQTLATGGNDHTVRLWDLAGWKPGERLPPCRVLKGHAGPVCCLAFDRDGTRLASTGFDDTVILWNPATGKKVRDPLCRVARRSRVAFHPDGNVLAAGQEDGTVVAYDTRTGEQLGDWPSHKDRVRAVAFSPDGKWVASSGGENVQVTKWATGKEIRRLNSGAEEVAFGPDGATLYAATSGTLRAWATADWRERPVFPGHLEQPVIVLAVHPGGRLVATAALDGAVVVRDIPTGRARVLTPGGEGEAHRATCLAFTPDGRYLVAASANGSVWVLRTPELPPPAEGTPSPQPIDLLAFADTTRDVARGKWERREADLVCSGPALLELPYQPPEEYDLTVAFTLNKKEHGLGLHLHFPIARNRCGRFGIEFSRTGQLIRECTDRTGTYWADVLDPTPALPVSRELRVEVRRTGVRLVDNGVPWRRLWDGGGKAPPGFSTSRDGGFPTLSGDGNVTCHKVEVTELSGCGWYPYGPPRK